MSFIICRNKKVRRRIIFIHEIRKLITFILNTKPTTGSIKKNKFFLYSEPVANDKPKFQYEIVSFKSGKHYVETESTCRIFVYFIFDDSFFNPSLLRDQSFTHKKQNRTFNKKIYIFQLIQHPLKSTLFPISPDKTLK